MPNPLLDAALKYADMGLSVIPVNPTMDERFEKQSFVEWKRFQKERPTKEQIKKWWEKWPAAMVGVVTGEVSNIFAVDGDNEEAEEQLENLIPENLCTPTTKSPHGKHVIFEYHPGIHNYNKNNGNVKFHVRGQGGYIIFPPSTRENGLRYEWLVSPDDIPFAPAPAALINIINKCIIGGYGGEGRNSDDKDHVTNVTRYFQDHQRDEHLFHAANCLVKGGAEYDFALNILKRLAGSCPPGDHPLEKNIAEIKLKSALQRAQRRDRNIQQEVESWVADVTSGYFLVTDCYAELQLLHPEEKTACRVALHRMKEQGLIEETGDRRGKYRKRKTEIIRIDLDAPRMPRLDLQWPLEIEKYVYINPKSIIVNAGETDAGKTAFNIDFCAKNKGHHKIHFFVTEMGTEDMQDRLSLYGEPLEWWKDLDIIERENDFEDAIFPDDINIIDYLSVPIDKVWTIKEPIDKVFFKLKKGIALISLQMGQGQNLPYGKSWGIERSRLAITLKRVDRTNVAEIIKAKNWVKPKARPTGLKAKYWCIDGCRIEKKGEWE